MIAGARIIKTGIAVTISMFLCDIFNIQPAIFAGAATVLNMQPSVGKSLYNAKEQIIVHFVSIGIAIISGLILGTHAISMGFSTVLVILICNNFKWRSGMSGGIMAAIFILGSPPDQFVNHALIRSMAIVVGVAVALIINITIAPPKYDKMLKEKMLELNSTITDLFNNAVHSYLQLQLPSPAVLEENRKIIEKLIQETNHLYDLYRYDLGPVIDPIGEKKEIKLFREYFTYCKGLWQRTKDINFLANERLERRHEAGDLPISNEFNKILQLIEKAQDLYLLNNNKLKDLIIENKTSPSEEPHIWSQLDVIINQWHNTYPEGSYYLHALIEISLITYKVRWAAKESVRLIQTYTT